MGNIRLCLLSFRVLACDEDCGDRILVDEREAGIKAQERSQSGSDVDDHYMTTIAGIAYRATQITKRRTVSSWIERTFRTGKELHSRCCGLRGSPHAPAPLLRTTRKSASPSLWLSFRPKASASASVLKRPMKIPHHCSPSGPSPGAEKAGKPR